MKRLKKVDYMYSYDEIVSSMGVTVLHEWSVGDWQGDYFFFVRKGESYGLIIGGYGSCSGCDVLESIGNDVVEATELRDDLYNSITWRSRDEMVEYLASGDLGYQWWGNSRQALQEVQTCLGLL